MLLVGRRGRTRISAGVAQWTPNNMAIRQTKPVGFIRRTDPSRKSLSIEYIRQRWKKVPLRTQLLPALVDSLVGGMAPGQQRQIA